MSKGKNFTPDQLRQMFGLALSKVPVRESAEIMHCSPSTVCAAGMKLEAYGITSVIELSYLSDQEILDIYYKTGRAVCCKGDVVVIRERSRKHLEGAGRICRPNLQRFVEMHLEQRISREMCFNIYLQETREEDGIPVSRTTFLDGLRTLLNLEQGPNDVYMHQDHPYGFEIGIDYCGDTFPVLMPDGTTEQYAVCVLAWAASYMTYAELIPHQTTKDTCSVIAHAIQRWQCTSRILTCDNAKSMVIKHTTGREPLFNKSFEQFVHSLGMTINANKPYGPTGKGYVEKEVDLIQSRCLSLMRMMDPHMTLIEANTKLMELVDREINAAPFRNNGKGSPRQVLFEKYERPAAVKFNGVIPEYREHVMGLAVGRDYTVYIKGHHYSVPWRYAHDIVNASLSATKVYISSYQGLIAEHQRSDDDEKYTILPEHMPESHLAMKLKRSDFSDPASVINAAKVFSDTLYSFTQQFFESHTMEKVDCPLSIIRAYQKHTAEHRIYDAALRRLMELESDKWTSYRYNTLVKEIKDEVASNGMEATLSNSSHPQPPSDNQHVCLHDKITISNAGRHKDPDGASLTTPSSSKENEHDNN